MDIITQFHTALGTNSLDFIFQFMTSIAFTVAVIYAGKVALAMHRDRAAARFNQELEADEQALQEKVDAYAWDHEEDYTHKVDLIKRAQ
jgi:L-ascorbate metabolism protein UlaG (beta-lactamase superfamily)